MPTKLEERTKLALFDDAEKIENLVGGDGELVNQETQVS